MVLHILHVVVSIIQLKSSVLLVSKELICALCRPNISRKSWRHGVDLMTILFILGVSRNQEHLHQSVTTSQIVMDTTVTHSRIHECILPQFFFQIWRNISILRKYELHIFYLNMFLWYAPSYLFLTQYIITIF